MSRFPSRVGNHLHVGESGSGKSVTARAILQIVDTPGRITGGRILFNREGQTPLDLAALHPRSRAIRELRGHDIAMIFQEPMTSLNPVYTVGDQICEAILLHQNVDPSRAWQIAIDAMRSVGIPEPERRIKGYPHQFSGGMRQRVMIAMALACQPQLLIADEPTTALDVTIQAQILELLGELKRERGMGVMLITHDLGVVAENADVVCVMYAGRVVEYANVLELFNNPMHPYTRGLLASIPKLGQRRERLVTIKEIIEDPEQFKKLPGAETGIRPWWPWNDPPADLKPRPGRRGTTSCRSRARSTGWACGAPRPSRRTKAAGQTWRIARPSRAEVVGWTTRPLFLLPRRGSARQ